MNVGKASKAEKAAPGSICQKEKQNGTGTIFYRTKGAGSNKPSSAEKAGKPKAEKPKQIDQPKKDTQQKAGEQNSPITTPQNTKPDGPPPTQEQVEVKNKGLETKAKLQALVKEWQDYMAKVDVPPKTIGDLLPLVQAEEAVVKNEMLSALAAVPKDFRGAADLGQLRTKMLQSGVPIEQGHFMDLVEDLWKDGKILLQENFRSLSDVPDMGTLFWADSNNGVVAHDKIILVGNNPALKAAAQEQYVETKNSEARRKQQNRRYSAQETQENRWRP